MEIVGADPTRQADLGQPRRLRTRHRSATSIGEENTAESPSCRKNSPVSSE
jgi:hypothetical protein